MKQLLSLLLLLAAVLPAFGCWSTNYPIVNRFALLPGGAGFCCADANGNPQDSGADLTLGIRCVRVGYHITSTNTETGEIVYENIIETIPEGTPDYTVYIYRCDGEDNGGYIVGALLETRQITPVTSGSGNGDSVTFTPIDSVSNIFSEFPDEDSLLLSLWEPVGTKVKLTNNFRYAGYCKTAVLSRAGSLDSTTVKTVNFSNCSLSVPGTVLPLTPTLTVAPITVTTRTYAVGCFVYEVRTAVQNPATVSVAQGPTSGGPEPVTYSAPVTAARLTVTDSDGGRETFSAAALQTGSGLPVWGRYGVNPWGIAVGEQLKFDLVLTADGVNSNQANDRLTIVTPPAVSTATVTVTGDNRPER